jgi:hypothetical protein
MSAETLIDGLRLSLNYLLMAALYYVFVAYPLIRILRRRRR